MTDYIPFEESKRAIDLLRKGKSLSVLFMYHNDDEYKEKYLKQLGFEKHHTTYYCTILCEIGNMPGHYVVIGNDKVVSGLHGDNFYIDEDELNDIGIPDIKDCFCKGDSVIILDDFDSSYVDIEEIIEDLGYDPRDGKTVYTVLEEEENESIGLEIDGSCCYVPVEICRKV